MLILVPSDKLDLPDDSVVSTRATAAVDEITSFYRDRTSGLIPRFSAPKVLHAAENVLWFTTDSQNNRVSLDPGKITQFLSEQGYGGICADNWIAIVLFATTWQGGYSGGTRCEDPILHAPNSSPTAGPGRSGYVLLSQWVLDHILTGGDSTSCLTGQGETGPVDAWKCQANTLGGTLMHELGHAFGLNHPCQGWEADNWRLTSYECNTLVMQSHWNYPNVGFDTREVAILALSPFLAQGSIPTPTPTSTATPTPTSTPTPTRTPTPTATPAIPTHDDFDSPVLDDRWTWVDPNGDSSYSLTAHPGWLRISVPKGGHDLYPGNNMGAPRLLQTLPGDFALATRVSTNPTSVYQAAGILVWGNSNDFVRLEREISGVSMHFSNQGTYDGVSAVPTGATVLYLRMTRSGSTFVGSFSTDGTTWIQVGTVQSEVGSSPLAGLTVLDQWQDNPYLADFDYFYH